MDITEILEQHGLTINTQDHCLCYGLSLDEAAKLPKTTTFIAPWRADFLNMIKNNDHVYPDFSSTEKDQFDRAFLKLGKHKARDINTALLLYERLKKGGQLFIYGHKTIGAASFYKNFSKYFQLEAKINKNHHILFWLTKGETQQALDLLWQPNQKFMNFETAPGVFSHGHIDEASFLLKDTLPKIAFSKTADFGSGWGYLSTQIFKQTSEIDLYEADYEALKLAKGNMNQHLALDNHDPTAVNYFWHDITLEPIIAAYDTIISNPPFHSGTTQNIALGQTFLITAAKALKRGGTLYLVANRHLAYEKTLKCYFSHFQYLQQTNRFKVIEAKKI